MNRRLALLFLSFAAFAANVLPGQRRPPGPPENILIERDVAVPMRDGMELRADVWRPSGPGPFPILIYRTPYNRRNAEESYSIFVKAVARGYAVVIQDVRGRYASAGEFVPYQNEGRDGYDTIEWAARQPWSNGSVGTFGLSYPGAVQWLAAMERPPHLKAMVPAMTFSTPRNFFYSGGVFDLSWIAWIWNNIAPDTRARKNLPGPKTSAEARAAWAAEQDRLRRFLPLIELPDFKDVAPYYAEWLAHPPEDPWWDWAELRGKYARVDAAVLNFSGWYDEAYGPEGATTNFMGLAGARKGATNPRTKLVIGPWTHGIPGPEDTRAGEREFGPAALIDYDEMVLRWMDCYVRGIENGVDREKPVRLFVMGANHWREEDSWPIRGTKEIPFYLAAPVQEESRIGKLDRAPALEVRRERWFESDPSNPLTDPHPPYSGAHDYSSMAERGDVLVYDSEPLKEDMEVTGRIKATIYLSCDAADTDLWVRLLDVAPDGKALNLMNPGLDVIRASYAEPGRRRKTLVPGRVFKLELTNLLTSNVFKQGHRIRVQISSAFFPHFSRNLHTGALESTSVAMRKAVVRIHHDREYRSHIVLPVIQR